MADWGGKIAAWFAGVAIVSATLAALVAQTASPPLHGRERTLFVVLIFVAAVSFVALLLTGPRALWAAWHNRQAAAPSVHFSLFERRYRKLVRAAARYVDTKGLGIVGFYTPELDEVFIDVSLTYRPPQQVSPSLFDDSPMAIKERLALGDLIKHSQPMVLAILGGPGSGKSTLLRYTSRHARRRRRSRQHVPILLYLREHSSTIIKEQGIGLGDLVRNTIGDLRRSEPAGWFEQKLRNGECLVLLDGLDEIADNETRRKVSAWIERQFYQYQDNQYVVTSRPLGYLSSPIDGATVLQVRSFTTDQVKRFVYGWYRATERDSTGMGGQELLLRADSFAADLLRRLDATPALSDLAVNPMLLTMIANVHRFNGALPGSRADLYSTICDAVLFRRQEAKNLRSQLTGSAKEKLLSSLAYTMMERHVSDGLSAEGILTAFRSTLPRLSRKARAEDVLADIVSTGLLVEGESGQYRFAHHTFQEYLAAVHIRSYNLAEALANAVDDAWWRETSLLYAARSNADSIVTACLNCGSVTALTLAFDCIAQPTDLSADLRESLDKLLDSSFAPGNDADRRRLIARTLLTRHLRRQLRIADSTIKWTQPITANLYWLFLVGAHQHQKETPILDHLDDEKLALGISSTDTTAFTRWLNRTIGEGRGYRLPKPSELSVATIEHLVGDQQRSAGYCVWVTADDAKTPELWVPPGLSHPYVLDSKTLISYVKADIARSTSAVVTLALLRAGLVARVLAGQLEYDSERPGSHEKELADSLARSLISNDEKRLDLSEARELARRLHQNINNASSLGSRSHLVRRFLAILRQLLGYSSHDLAFELSRNLDQDLAYIDDTSVVSGNGLITEAEHGGAVHHILALDRGLNILHSDEDALNRSLGIDRTGLLRHIPDVDQMMLDALPAALARALRTPVDPRVWLVEFSDGFVEATCTAKSPEQVAPEIANDKTITQESIVAQSSQESTAGSALNTYPSSAFLEVFSPEVSLEGPAGTSVSDASPALGAARLGYTKARARVQAQLRAVFHMSAVKRTVDPVAEAGNVVFPDVLGDELRTAVNDLSSLCASRRGKGVQDSLANSARSHWITDMASRLLEQAIPVFHGEKSPTADTSSGIRLAALCLAAEADDLDRHDLSITFRKAAMGITILQRRSSEEVMPAEIILLVPE